MTTSLIKVTMLGLVIGRVLPAVVLGVANTVAAMLTAHILVVAAIGLSPALLIAQRAPRPDASPPVLDVGL